MATREENLKKINDELEMLSDEELERVAGGFTLPRGTIEMLEKLKNKYDNKSTNFQTGLEQNKKYEILN